MKKLMLGDFAVARGAYEAGVKVACAYPGTPSTEITEELARFEGVYAEWSPNEKVALETGIGASIRGARTIVSMKHVGLNVAADPLFTVSYTGVNGGLVIVVADDPGMHSSQNEQDTRLLARAAKVPVLEPSDSEECKTLTALAFELSEKYDTPIILRLTTRVAHSQSLISLGERKEVPIKDYQKNAPKFVMMPANAKKRHIEVENRLRKLECDCDDFDINFAEINGKDLGIICAGGVYQFVKEAFPEASVFKLGMVYPLPYEKIRQFAKEVKRLIVVEELQPHIEGLLKLNGIECEGKNIFTVLGEFSASYIKSALECKECKLEPLDIPIRPPVLCAGCPHRGLFYVLSKLKLKVMGDIGCYTLGAIPPLNAIDAVICMGASIGMTAGFEKADALSKKNTVAVIGDSTFIHSGITGLINAVYNGASSTIIIADNSTTGMTGHQHHPATGKRIDNMPAPALDLEKICRACGVNSVRVVDPYDLTQLESILKEELNKDEVSVIITKRPCVLLFKKQYKGFSINEKCINCGACLRIGCPAISKKPKSVVIDASLCTDCGLCQKMCKFGAIDGDADLSLLSLGNKES